MKMEPIVSSETSAIRTQTPGNYPKRNKLHLEHGESLKTRISELAEEMEKVCLILEKGFQQNVKEIVMKIIDGHA